MDAIRIGAAPVAGSVRCEVGESPLWVGSSRRLYWVDIPAGALRWLESDGGQGAAAVDAELGFVAEAAPGQLVLGTATGLRIINEPDTATLAERPLPWHPPDLNATRKVNDGSCDPRGRLIFGTTAVSGTDVLGTLWCCEAGSSGRPLLSRVHMANGLGWSADGRELFFVDTRTRRLAAYPYEPDAGRIAGPPRRVHDVGWQEGLPDGLAVDAEGCVWLAVWGAGEVRRLTPEGRLVSAVRLPTPKVSSCAFGGPELADLYITTAADGLASDPLAGRLFVASPGIAGQPVPAFAGCAST